MLPNTVTRTEKSINIGRTFSTILCFTNKQKRSAFSASNNRPSQEPLPTYKYTTMNSDNIHNKSAYTTSVPSSPESSPLMQLVLSESDLVTLEDAMQALAEGTSSSCSSRNHNIQVSFLSLQ